jgi:cytochrome P450 family 2 subfamily J
VDQLLTSIVNLFIGGTETTSTTLRWALIYMIENPEVQEKVFEEIRLVVGTARDVTLEDKGIRSWKINKKKRKRNSSWQ